MFTLPQQPPFFHYHPSNNYRGAAQTGAGTGARRKGNGLAPLPLLLLIGKTSLAEYAKLTAERETLNRRYLALKGEVKEAEQIRRSVYNILRQEQREQQPRRAQDMER